MRLAETFPFAAHVRADGANGSNGRKTGESATVAPPKRDFSSSHPASVQQARSKVGKSGEFGLTGSNGRHEAERDAPPPHTA